MGTQTDATFCPAAMKDEQSCKCQCLCTCLFVCWRNNL